MAMWVPPGEGWTVDPYGGEVRGATCMVVVPPFQSRDFATYAFALLALETLHGDLSGTIELHLTYDEETGGEIGPKWLLDQALTKPDYAICAGFSYAVVNAHNGCLHLEGIVRGKIAHAALPDRGHDALEAANAILTKLYDYRRGLSAATSVTEGIESPTLVVGLISGGVNTNVVPDKVSFRIDRRMIPEEDPVAVESELRTLIEGVASMFPGIACDVNQILLAEPLVPLPESDRLVQLIAKHGERIFGQDNRRPWRAALHRRAPLRQSRHSHRTLRLRSGVDRRGWRARVGRARRARRPQTGDRGNRLYAVFAISRRIVPTIAKKGVMVGS